MRWIRNRNMQDPLIIIPEVARKLEENLCHVNRPKAINGFSFPIWEGRVEPYWSTVQHSRTKGTQTVVCREGVSIGCGDVHTIVVVLDLNHCFVQWYFLYETWVKIAKKSPDSSLISNEEVLSRWTQVIQWRHMFILAILEIDVKPWKNFFQWGVRRPAKHLKRSWDWHISWWDVFFTSPLSHLKELFTFLAPFVKHFHVSPFAGSVTVNISKDKERKQRKISNLIYVE